MKIAVLFGGSSFEHEISIVSAVSLKKVLRHDCLFVFVDSARDFYFIPPSALTSRLFSSGEFKSYPKLTLKKGGFYQKGLFGESRIAFDIGLNLIHGRDGEDGKIPALFSFYGIPCITPGITACSISYDKLLTKGYAKALGVNTLPCQILKSSDPREITVGYPVIIKPLRLGSSIGVSVVKSAEGLDYALDVAYEFDDTVLIEPFIENIKEYNLAGCKGKNGFIYSLIEEPEKKELLDFDKKYMDFSRTQRVKKAEIDAALEQQIKDTFATLYGSVFEGSMIRCDFFVHEGTVCLNEINPIPGSMANYLFDDFNAALDSLIFSLPKEKPIPIDYQYIHKIEVAKGK